MTVDELLTTIQQRAAEDALPPYVATDRGTVELYPNGPHDVGRCLTPDEAEALAAALVQAAAKARKP